MEKFTTLTGVAAPLEMINVDTDMIIPKQYLKTLGRTGLAKALLSELRFDEQGNERPDFVLNKPAYRQSKILVAGDNFGCGSSREHAPWALMDFGIRCVISTSFADIFFNNCFQNGMVPIRLDEADVDELFRRATAAAAAGGQYSLRVDLQACTVSDDAGFTRSFAVDPFRRQCLLEGHDDIDLSLRHADKITAWEADRGLPALSG